MTRPVQIWRSTLLLSFLRIWTHIFLAYPATCMKVICSMDSSPSEASICSLCWFHAIHAFMVFRCIHLSNQRTKYWLITQTIISITSNWWINGAYSWVERHFFFGWICPGWRLRGPPGPPPWVGGGPSIQIDFLTALLIRNHSLVK